MECNTDVHPPAYLQRRDTYDLSSVADPDYKDSIQPFHSLREEAWPRMEELGLDESQMKAFQLALTKELAIIQGPPGTGETLKSNCWTDEFIHFWMKTVKCISPICRTTKYEDFQSFCNILNSGSSIFSGKTYVGLKIAEALLTNQDLWKDRFGKGPMLVVCYTNHALDQFLEGKQWSWFIVIYLLYMCWGLKFDNSGSCEQRVYLCLIRTHFCKVYLFIFVCKKSKSTSSLIQLLFCLVCLSI